MKEGKGAEEPELEKILYGTGGTGVSQTRNTDGGDVGKAERGGKAVAGTGNGASVAVAAEEEEEAAEEKEEQLHEGAAVGVGKAGKRSGRVTTTWPRREGNRRLRRSTNESETTKRAGAN